MNSFPKRDLKQVSSESLSERGKEGVLFFVKLEFLFEDNFVSCFNNENLLVFENETG